MKRYGLLLIGLISLAPTLSSCQTTKRPGVTSTNGYFLRYTDIPAQRVTLATISTFDQWSLIFSNRKPSGLNGEVITGINSQGTKFKVRINSQNHSGTKLEVRIEPGHNEGVSLQLIDAILENAKD